VIYFSIPEETKTKAAIKAGPELNKVSVQLRIDWKMELIKLIAIFALAVAVLPQV
jgi:hypothetical protein